MQDMKLQREKANDNADLLEEKLKVANVRLNKVQLEYNDLEEQCRKLEIEFKECQEEYTKADKLVDKKDRQLCDVRRLTNFSQIF